MLLDWKKTESQRKTLFCGKKQCGIWREMNTPQQQKKLIGGRGNISYPFLLSPCRSLLRYLRSSWPFSAWNFSSSINPQKEIMSFGTSQSLEERWKSENTNQHSDLNESPVEMLINRTRSGLDLQGIRWSLLSIERAKRRYGSSENNKIKTHYQNWPIHITICGLKPKPSQGCTYNVVSIDTERNQQMFYYTYSKAVALRRNMVELSHKKTSPRGGPTASFLGVTITLLRTRW